MDLAGFIKERQVHQVRVLRQAALVVPRLAIVQTLASPVIGSYVALKQAYGADVGIEVDAHFVPQTEAVSLVQALNADSAVHGIIIQLPLPDPAGTDTLVNTVIPGKDVDGLGKSAAFDPATPTAVLWLLAGYNIDLRGKKIVVVGKGRLVGSPLIHMLQSGSYDVEAADHHTTDLGVVTRQADILITATGSPGLITSDMVQPGAVVIDAGVATEAGRLVGDVADDVRTRDDLSITPLKGGVGPLTVCALFDNVIRAAQATRQR